MYTGLCRFLFVILAIFAFSCGGKTKKSKTGTDESSQIGQGNDQEKQAQKKIISWLGDEALRKVKGSASTLAKDIMLNAVKDAIVEKAFSNFTNSLFKEKSVKKITDKIMDKATKGFGNKLTLFGKALAAGGVSKYKKKIKIKTVKISEDIIKKHVEEKVLKDPRVANIIKQFLPVLSLQGKLAAATLQENLSPEIAQKVFGLSLKLSVAGKSEATSKKVEQWISSCDGHVEAELEKLFVEFANLQSVKQAVTGIIVEILGHPTTKKEIAVLIVNILNNPQAHKDAIKAYENVAFDKNSKQISNSIQKIIDLSITNDELFAALERLATAPGAGDLLTKHLAKFSTDPKVATLIDTFFINLLVTCGEIKI